MKGIRSHIVPILTLIDEDGEQWDLDMDACETAHKQKLELYGFIAENNAMYIKNELERGRKYDRNI